MTETATAARRSFRVGQPVQHRNGAAWDNACGFGVNARVTDVDGGQIEVEFEETGLRYWFYPGQIRHR